MCCSNDYNFLGGLLSPLFCITYLEQELVNNITVTRRYTSTFFLENFDFLVNFYFTTFMNIYSMIIPVISVLMCTVATVIKLKSSSEKIKDLSTNAMSKRVKDLRSVKISFFLSTALIFFVLVPSGILETLLAHGIIGKDLSLKIFNLITDSENILYIVNSSFNFVLYVLTSPKFAQTFTSLFNPKKQI